MGTIGGKIMTQCHYEGFEEEVIVDGKVVKRLVSHTPDLALYAWNTSHEKRGSDAKYDVLCSKCARLVGAWQIRGKVSE